MNRPVDPYALFRRAQDLFALRDYAHAAEQLEIVMTSAGDEQGLHETRQLLARSYYHSAQLTKAEATARDLLDLHPDDAYAALLLGRTLERLSRHAEARSYLAMARAYGLEVPERGSARED